VRRSGLFFAAGKWIVLRAGEWENRDWHGLCYVSAPCGSPLRCCGCRWPGLYWPSSYVPGRCFQDGTPAYADGNRREFVLKDRTLSMIRPPGGSAPLYGARACERRGNLLGNKGALPRPGGRYPGCTLRCKG